MRDPDAEKKQLRRSRETAEPEEIYKALKGFWKRTKLSNVRHIVLAHLLAHTSADSPQPITLDAAKKLTIAGLTDALSRLVCLI